MVTTEDQTGAVVRIGKVDFAIAASDTPPERCSREERTQALTRWLLAEWRRERGEDRT